VAFIFADRDVLSVPLALRDAANAPALLIATSHLESPLGFKRPNNKQREVQLRKGTALLQQITTEVQNIAKRPVADIVWGGVSVALPTFASALFDQIHAWSIVSLSMQQTRGTTSASFKCTNTVMVLFRQSREVSLGALSSACEYLTLVTEPASKYEGKAHWERTDRSCSPVERVVVVGLAMLLGLAVTVHGPR
jgi:hypothetical protein